jgi:hypothetical protein
VGWKGHDLSFLGCKRYSADRLSSHWPNNYRAILRKPPRPNTGKDTRIKARFIKEKKSSLQDNVHPHTSVIAMAKIHELRYELLPYSPDLTPSEFNLFSRLKIFLGGPRFSITEKLTAKVEGYFEGLEECHFRDGIKALEHRWTKCISLQGDYVENKNTSTEVRHFFLVHSENFSNHPHTCISLSVSI